MPLADARAAVLARLWGALAREPLDQVARREPAGDLLHVHLSDGRVISGPAEAAELFARPEAGLTVGGHTDPAQLVAAVFPEAVSFRAEIDNSVANLAAARAAQPPPHGGPPELIRGHRLAFFEQSVVDGHPIHPLCRTRMGMSPQENRAYAPEFRPVVNLATVRVPAHRWITGGQPLPPVLPVHPWQRDHVLERYELHPTGQSIPVRPLMSLRTVARLDAPRWHLKTSVDVQMTSAVRIVSPAAIHNGPVVSRLLAELCQAEPIDVMAEVATGAVLVDGEPCRSLAFVHRRAPRLRRGDIAIPFGALAAPSPASGRAYLTEAIGDCDPVAYLGDLLALMLPPLLRLLHLGIALEAHGQNLLLVLRDGRPLRLAYRDMGGVRLHQGRLRRAGIEAPLLRGDLATDDEDELRTKLLAAVVSTVVGELIATAAREYGIEPGELWAVAADVIRRTYADLPREATPDQAVILGSTLPIKATTAMRLSTRPLEDIWAPLRNPMARL